MENYTVFMVKPNNSAVIEVAIKKNPITIAGKEAQMDLYNTFKYISI